MKYMMFVGSALTLGLIKWFTVLSMSRHLGYKEFIVSKKGREGELLSSIFCLFIWIMFFCWSNFREMILLFSPEVSALFFGCMCGISISTIYTLRFMPKGIYEKGVLTETKPISYKNISRVSKDKTNNKRISKYVFHMKEGKPLNLYVHTEEQGKMTEVLKRHKLKA